jgi:hypothetical protein
MMVVVVAVIFVTGLFRGRLSVCLPACLYRQLIVVGQEQ